MADTRPLIPFHSHAILALKMWFKNPIKKITLLEVILGTRKAIKEWNKLTTDISWECALSIDAKISFRKTITPTKENKDFLQFLSILRVHPELI
jgi:hypothetical protein